MRICIVDDEPLARAAVRHLSARHSDVEVIGEAATGVDAVALIVTTRPDVVFLDISMPDLDGFGVLEKVEAKGTPHIVFITAHCEFAVRAFDIHALDYLLKPFSNERFDESLSRARDAMKGRQVARDRLVVRVGDRRLLLNTADVTHLTADDYYTSVHVHGRSYLLRESLNALENELDTKWFARIHRSSMVNLAHVRELKSARDGTLAVVLQDGTSLRVSRTRRASLEAMVGVAE